MRSLVRVRGVGREQIMGRKSARFRSRSRVPLPTRPWDILNKNLIKFWPGRPGPRPAPDPPPIRAEPAPGLRLSQRLGLRLDSPPDLLAWRLHSPHSYRLRPGYVVAFTAFMGLVRAFRTL